MTDKIARAILAKLEAEFFAAVTGPVKENRATALRIRGTSFEVVTLDDNGLVIEPVRCTCRVGYIGFPIADFTCPLHGFGVLS